MRHTYIRRHTLVLLDDSVYDNTDDHVYYLARLHHSRSIILVTTAFYNPNPSLHDYNPPLSPPTYTLNAEQR